MKSCCYWIIPKLESNVYKHMGHPVVCKPHSAILEAEVQIDWSNY